MAPLRGQGILKHKKEKATFLEGTEKPLKIGRLLDY
jgi:hypothetical protein